MLSIASVIDGSAVGEKAKTDLNETAKRKKKSASEASRSLVLFPSRFQLGLFLSPIVFFCLLHLFSPGRSLVPGWNDSEERIPVIDLLWKNKTQDGRKDFHCSYMVTLEMYLFNQISFQGRFCDSVENLAHETDLH